MLEIIDLTFYYGNIKALDRVTFKIKDGSFVLIVGANASGKTTLLKILCGLLPIQKGKIMFDKKELSQNDLRYLCGYVFHNPLNQIVGTTVEEDIAFGLENIGMERNRMIKEVEKTLKSFGLYELKEKDPATLSAGQLQKLATASVTVLKPKYLFLDEPTSMLDEQDSKQIKQCLKDLNDSGITILVSTHDLEQFLDTSNWIIHLNNGKIDFEGEIKEFLEKDFPDVERPGCFN
ncbi:MULTISPECIES: energy-coupling factor ABC transporter ATP-binding protein [Pseudothermotoga]|uniref:ABC transporter related n=1 Tax=Pseudothermotoga lettingae (strain ATCC BAA-301 / DSM 14385 / NBRC 107922 / TMO) TaxID=416591 RepID=A8F737_PSELT|nr:MULTISPECIES: ABC transporter ATP-binding protein [Pseudothermotoga]ABV33971.1 ABC transporter related [Pseudothermotoga lettingae TMO]GLI49091.1 energy-coupling factor transporter ATP-binding protein EcfA1 [Pseudothermotoga lettingae TMO]